MNISIFFTSGAEPASTSSTRGAPQSHGGGEGGVEGGMVGLPACWGGSPPGGAALAWGQTGAKRHLLG